MILFSGDFEVHDKKIHSWRGACKVCSVKFSLEFVLDPYFDFKKEGDWSPVELAILNVYGISFDCSAQLR